MKVSDKIVIDLTKPLANVGVKTEFHGEFLPAETLLPYPNAQLLGVAVDFSVTFLKPDVAVQGEIVCHVVGQCDKCLADVDKRIVLPFEQTFFKDKADGYCYEGSRLDATKAVQDEIVLSLPTLLLCSTECKGLCPKCGVNKNTTECDCDTRKENPFSQLLNLKF